MAGVSHDELSVQCPTFLCPPPHISAYTSRMQSPGLVSTSAYDVVRSRSFGGRRADAARPARAVFRACFPAAVLVVLHRTSVRTNYLPHRPAKGRFITGREARRECERAALSDSVTFKLLASRIGRPFDSLPPGGQYLDPYVLSMLTSRTARRRAMRRVGQRFGLGLSAIHSRPVRVGRRSRAQVRVGFEKPGQLTRRILHAARDGYGVATRGGSCRP